MAQYKIPVKWEMQGYIKTPCNNLKEAIAYALSQDADLPRNREYVEGSVRIDIGRLYRDARYSFPDSDAPYFQELLDSVKKEGEK